jgi:beta-galactosidase
VHDRRYATWDDVHPPERFDAEKASELPIHLDWARFQEHLIETSLRRLRRRMARAGLAGVAVTHNVALGDGGQPVSVPGIDGVVDLVGFDYYHAARDFRTLKRRTLYLAGTLTFPYAPELGVGAPPWFVPLSHDDSIFCAMEACAYGLRGFNLYMAVDRDRWYGAPIDAHGTPRVEAAVWKHLVQALVRLEFHKLERPARVALMVPREYARLSRQTHVLGPLSPSTLEAVGGTPVDGSSEDPLGFAGPVQVLWWRMLAKAADALTHLGVPYLYVDSEAPVQRFDDVELVIVFVYEFVD